METKAQNPVAAFPVTDEEKMKCAEREAKLRKHVYPRWIMAGRINKASAAHEIRCMEAIAADYRAKFEAGRLI